MGGGGGGGGEVSSSSSGPKKVPIAVVVPVEACGNTPEAEAGVLAEVVALRRLAAPSTSA